MTRHGAGVAPNARTSRVAPNYSSRGPKPFRRSRRGNVELNSDRDRIRCQSRDEVIPLGQHGSGDEGEYAANSCLNTPQC